MAVGRAQAQADEDARWQRLQAMKEQDADRRARAQAVKERHAAVRLSKMELAAAWKLKRAEREQSEQQRRWEVIERINADRAVSAAEDIRRRSAAIRKGFRLDEFGDVTFVNGEWRVRVADETETGTWMVPGDLRPVIAGSDLDKVAFDTTGPVPEMYPGLCRVPTVPEVLAMERRRSSSRRLTVVSIGHCRPTSGPGSSPANIVWTPGSLATSSSKRIAPLVASRLRTLPTMGHSFGQSADDFVASVPVGIRRPPDRVAMQTPPLLIPSIAWLRQHARPKAQGLHYDHRAYFREALARIAPLYSAGRRRSGSTSCL